MVGAKTDNHNEGESQKHFEWKKQDTKKYMQMLTLYKV